jgi:hypothetical protein
VGLLEGSEVSLTANKISDPTQKTAGLPASQHSFVPSRTAHAADQVGQAQLSAQR